MKVRALITDIPVSKLDEIAELVDGLPATISNRILFGMYRQDGGTVSWKTFRRAVAICRGGEVAHAELDRVDAEYEEEMARKERVAWQLAAAAVAKSVAAEKEKGEKMAVRREDLRKGQRVFVRVRYADQVKLRPASVNQVMRGAVNVIIDDEDTPRTVRFNEIEIDEARTPRKLTQVEIAAAAAVEEGRVERRGPEVAVKRAPPPSPVAVPAPQAEPTSSASQDDDEVNAWIAKGSSMRDNLVSKQMALTAAMDELVLEALRIEELLAAKKAEHARVTSLLAALDQMRAVAAA